METARLVGLDPEIEPDLLEWDYGRYVGITTAEIRETEPRWSVWTHPVLGARWLGLDAVEGRHFALDTATMSILGWERENRVVLRWNDPCGWD